MVSDEALYDGGARVRAPVPLSSAAPGAPVSAVSWAAILAGAAAAAALSLLLLLLGVGLGLSAVSPWAGDGAGAAALGVSGIVWLAFTQLAASGLGGYLAGRLRVRWRDTDVDEVHFRDTAHGLLTWAVATLVTAAVLTSSVGAVLGLGARTAASVAGGVAAGAAGSAVSMRDGQGSPGMPDVAGTASGAPGRSGAAQSLDYFVDVMMRRAGAATAVPDELPAGASSAPGTPSAPTGAIAPNPATLRSIPDPATAQASVVANAELGRLLARAMRDGGVLSAEDSRQAGLLVAQRTGLPQAEAERRVTATLARAHAEAQSAETQAREAADTARKAALHGALWMVVALLLGAFTASLLATFGGRQRDRIG